MFLHWLPFWNVEMCEVFLFWFVKYAGALLTITQERLKRKMCVSVCFKQGRHSTRFAVVSTAELTSYASQDSHSECLCV